MSPLQTQIERIAALEVQVSVLQYSIDAGSREARARHESMEAKLNDLIQLKHKGMGAFWLASALAGTGILTLFWTAVEWFKA